MSTDSEHSGAKLELELELERPPPACEAEIITRAQASALTAAAARRRLDFDDDVRLLDAAQAGGDEVSTDSEHSGIKLELEVLLLPAKQK